MKTLKGLLIFVIIIFIFCAGALTGQKTFEPQVIYIDNYIDKPYPIIQIQTIEIPLMVPLELQDWASLDELTQFLAEDDTDTHIYLTADADGIVGFSGQCEDTAFQLRARAEAIGKRLETEILTRTEYIKYYGTGVGFGINDGHSIVKAVVGNNVYFIEPTNDKIWLAYYLD